MKRISLDEQVVDKLKKKKAYEEEKGIQTWPDVGADSNLKYPAPSDDKSPQAQQYTIPTGNAQLVYGIEGKEGEEFEVKEKGTMLPIGKYRVVGKPETDVEHSGFWGVFSDVVVERIPD